MRKFIIPAAMVVTAGLAYVGTAAWIGGALVDEAAALQRRLLSVDGMSVRKLSYEKRLFDGELVFDVAWAPPAGHPLQEAMTLAGRRDIPLSGRAAVAHGPWVGGLGIARSSMALPLPEDLRAHLPKYPGQSPWLKLDALVDWSRRLTVEFRVVDYAGAIGPAILGMEASLEGTGGRVVVQSGADQADASLSLPRLRVGTRDEFAELRDLRLSLASTRLPRERVKGEFSIASISGKSSGTSGMSMQAGPLRLELDATREWPFVWSGRSGLSLRDTRFEAAGTTGSLSLLSLRGETTRRDKRLASSSTLEIGASELRGVALPAFALALSLRELEGEPLGELVALANDAAQAGKDGFAAMDPDRVVAIARRLLAAGPTISVDRLALSVRGKDDIGLAASLGVPAGTTFSPERAMELAGAIDARAALSLDLASLEELILRGTALSAAIAGQPAPGQADIAAMRADFARERAKAARLPMVVVEGDKLRSEVRFAQGKLEANGKPVDLAEMMASAMGSLSGIVDALPGVGDMLGRPARQQAPQAAPRSAAPQPPAAAAPRPAARATQPNATAQPAFGMVALSADFQPDPHRVDVKAGGKDRVDARLGEECQGFIDATKPDFVLDYEAGQFDLFVYATSNDDTAIVLRAPDGKWHCNDDGANRGVDPTVQVRRPPSGRYAIWIATIEEGEADAELLISEADPDPKRPK
jgi:hypothetical protein